MKGLAVTAITLLMTAALGTATASPFEHGDNRNSSYANQRGAGDRGDRNDRGGRGERNVGVRNPNARFIDNRRFGDNNANRRWDNRDNRRWDNRDHDGRGGYRHGDRDGDGYNRGYYRNGYYGYNNYGYNNYYGYNGYRGYPGSVTFVVGGAPYYAAPYYADNSYAAAYPSDDNGYVACDPNAGYAPARYDNTGEKLLGGLVGGVIGNQFGRGNGRTAATVAGAVIGYGVAGSASNDRRYTDQRYQDGRYVEPCGG